MSTDSRITVTLSDGRQFGAKDVETLVAWAKDNRIPADSVITELGKPPVVASRHPALAGITVGAGAVLAAPPDDGGVSTLIPYRNVPALVGYYVSVASLVPGVGALAGPVAIGLGIAGLRKVKREPESKGTAHAIIAITLGSLTTLANLGCIGLAIFGAMSNRP